MKYLILGNGPAGVIAAETLRGNDPASQIVLAGSEHEPPYSRMAIPYLLEGNIDEAGTYLRKTPDHFAKNGITQLTTRAVLLEADKHQVQFADGHCESYDRLLIATGSHPVRPPIPGINLPQVHSCWTLEDARAIAALAVKGSRVVQLGAGFIGCIIMQALAERGVALTVVEMGDRMVPRMMTPTAGNMIREWVEQKGITVRTQASVEAITAGVDSALLVKLSTGESLACDLLIAAAGVAPNIEFLKGTAIEVGRGVRVNARMQTSIPDIYAAGDVAEAPDMFTGAPLVSAIQPNAADQARVAALNMSGKQTALPGVLPINVLDTLGLISSSFGQWWGLEEQDGVELVNQQNHHYISLQFDQDVLIGATTVGLTQHVGVLRGLIQSKTHLGRWKAILKDAPLRFPEAYLACQQSHFLK